MIPALPTYTTNNTSKFDSVIEIILQTTIIMDFSKEDYKQMFLTAKTERDYEHTRFLQEQIKVADLESENADLKEVWDENKKLKTHNYEIRENVHNLDARNSELEDKEKQLKKENAELLIEMETMKKEASGYAIASSSEDE